ncbi:SDR family NAD(P)-dependent oxidoreductase [Zavarzinia sp.]|uniref:SDR family NAD(P)-dependent oxidoreductase n=1 Tax=Zavarzinia sp. TaxID=2027920 RepID=UPI0035631226
MKGKVAIITGASSGIGRATAFALAEKGVRLVLASRGSAGEEVAAAVAAAGGEAEFMATDVADEAQCGALVAFAERRFGGLDFAFNNAGLQLEFADVHEFSPADASRVIDVNLKGIYNCMHYELAAMLRRGGGGIVNNSSIFGLKAMPHLAYYVASKHGVVGLTRAAALDYAGRGIRINAVCPGATKTASYDRVTGGDDHAYDAAIPLGRIAAAEEIARVVVWLLGADASYVTGAVLSADGGMSAA